MMVITVTILVATKQKIKKDREMKPIRIQRRRTKGWRMPKNTVYVGRGSKFGNPFRVGGLFKIGDVDNKSQFKMSWCECLNASYNDGSFQLIKNNKMAVDFYMKLIDKHPPKNIQDIKGKNLACWCPLDSPCHADILLELVNK
jgi:hypothetical protein